MCEIGSNQRKVEVAPDTDTVPVTVEYGDGTSKIIGYRHQDETAEEWAVRQARELDEQFRRNWNEGGFAALFGRRL